MADRRFMNGRTTDTRPRPVELNMTTIVINDNNVAQHIDNIVSACNQEVALTLSEGEIAYPFNRQQTYDNKAECNWIVLAPKGKVSRLYFCITTGL